MGILKRFKEIMSANINALLDKAEDPEKMVDQYLREMQEDLGKVKAETASVMADAAKAERDLNECDAEIAKMQKYAEKALLAGNEVDARQFLQRKAQLSSDRAVKAQMAETTKANAEKMRQMHDKLLKDIATLEQRKDSIRTKMAAARTQQKINDLNERVGSMNVTDGVSAFDRMEAKADRMLDEANARAELNNPSPESKTVDDLVSKYDEDGDSKIDDELAKMKAKLGL
ncbi:MAG: PspA/IM30 family protein [Eubacterium sp.]|nr:PspA/IM30 family protein [Eubacterium sp.]